MELEGTSPNVISNARLEESQSSLTLTDSIWSHTHQPPSPPPPPHITVTLFLLRTSKILPRLNVLFFFQRFEAQNVLILFLTAIKLYSFLVENRLQRPSGVYVCPVSSSETCVHARHVILMVLHVRYQVIICNKIYLMCDALCDHCLPRSFCYFFFLLSFCYFFFFSFFLNFHSASNCS